ncbi:MAG: hypothetical protein HY820_27560 [Acidobacteria bacterium]|nr:hypothetical protein [Acidobacteriota bacterium]
MPTLEEVQQVKEILTRKFMLPSPKRMGTNIVGIGIGTKVINEVSGIPCVQVYVSGKLDEENLVPMDRIPPEFLGVPTAVVDIGCAFSPQPRTPLESKRAEKGRLTLVPYSKVPRSSVNPSLKGTVCAMLVDEKTNERYILGCNHTLSANGRLPAGTEFYRPTDTERKYNIATLVAGGVVRLNADGVNLVDCAVAKLSSSAEIGADLQLPDGDLLNHDEAFKPARRKTVWKHGGVTGLTEGKIVDLDADIFVEYSFGTFRFAHQILVESDRKKEPFAVDGDSGAPVYTKDGTVVGIVFAPAGRLTAVCPIEQVMKQLNRELGKSGVKLRFEKTTSGSASA